MNILTFLALSLLSACAPAVVVEGDTNDNDGDGYSVADGDCADNNVNIFPGAKERWYDGVDQDCSGTSDYDKDGDGHDSLDYADDGHDTSGQPADDCDDEDAETYPGAPEIWYDGKDQDCSAGGVTKSTIDCDQDGDGYEAIGDATRPYCPGGTSGEVPHGEFDCNDLDPAINPLAVDDGSDDIDQNCDGVEGTDADYDGHASTETGGGDCDDGNRDVNPDATERWYDGVDQDCSGGSDYDKDGDGHDNISYVDDEYQHLTSDQPADDCDDEDPTIYQGC